MFLWKFALHIKVTSSCFPLICTYLVIFSVVLNSGLNADLEQHDGLLMETVCPRALKWLWGLSHRHFFEMGRAGGLQRPHGALAMFVLAIFTNHKPSEWFPPTGGCAWNFPTPPKCGQMPGTEAGASSGVLACSQWEMRFWTRCPHCLAPHRMQAAIGSHVGSPILPEAAFVFIVGRKPQDHLPGNGFLTQPDELLVAGCRA